MTQPPLDLSRTFELDHHGPDTYISESPPYAWGRIYGGLVVAQALWAAMESVREDHRVHSLHAYFILGGELGEPVRYEVDRVRNGRSFTTRRVVARQSGGAILTLGCSFQREEAGPETQSAELPANLPSAEGLKSELDAGIDRRDVVSPDSPPRSWIWCRFPESLGDDPRKHACALAYLSDLNPMSAIARAHPAKLKDEDWDESIQCVSLDHAMWFHRPVRADRWVFLDLAGHGVIGTRGLATGQAFHPDGTHVATIAQEGLMRMRRKQVL